MSLTSRWECYRRESIEGRKKEYQSLGGSSIVNPVYEIQEQFSLDSQKYKGFSYSKCDYIAFSQDYWPSYADMNEGQLNYFLYWRSQARKGIYERADLAYVLVYVYELINVIGVDTPRQAAIQLISLWKNTRFYSEEFDYQLRDWIADFIVMHNLSTPVLQWYAKSAEIGGSIKLMPYVNRTSVITREAWIQGILPFETLSHFFSEYRFYCGTSGFYTSFQKKYSGNIDLDKFYISALRVAEIYFREKKGKSIYSLGESITLKYHPFKLALHSYSTEMIDLTDVNTVCIGPSRHDKSVNDIVKSVVKFSENLLREQEEYPTRLRKISLDDELKILLQENFTKVYEAKSLRQGTHNSSIHPSKKQRIKLDQREIERLLKETQSIRDRLIFDEDSDEIMEDNSNETLIVNSEEFQVIKDLHIDLDPEWSEFVDSLLLVHWKFLKILIRQEKPSQLLENIARDANQTINILVDEINEISYMTIGDILIDASETPYLFDWAYEDMKHILSKIDNELIGKDNE